MPENTNQLLTIHEVSDLLKVPVSTLYRWRSRGEGPDGMRLGRHLRYASIDLERWLTQRVQQDRSTKVTR